MLDYLAYSERDPFQWRDCHASYVNLDHREDRRERMELSLKIAGISADRTPGIPWQNIVYPKPNGIPHLERGKLSKMFRRTPGAIGCHYSQVSIMTRALARNKSAFVMEDDLVFCEDMIDRLDIIERFCNQGPWDIIWLGATFHKEPLWHNHPHPLDLKHCDCSLIKDWEPTDNPNIVRTYGCWSTYAYIVNVESLPRILTLLDDNLHVSNGIDHLFIYLQPQLLTFSFVPGCIKQYDSKSDIGKGVTRFSQFSKLGPYWYQNKMSDYSPSCLQETPKEVAHEELISKLPNGLAEDA